MKAPKAYMAPCVRLAIFMTPNIRVKPNAMIIQMAVWTNAFKVTWTIIPALSHQKKPKKTFPPLEGGDEPPPSPSPLPAGRHGSTGGGEYWGKSQILLAR